MVDGFQGLLVLGLVAVAVVVAECSVGNRETHGHASHHPGPGLLAGHLVGRSQGGGDLPDDDGVEDDEGPLGVGHFLGEVLQFARYFDQLVVQTGLLLDHSLVLVTLLHVLLNCNDD